MAKRAQKVMQTLYWIRDIFRRERGQEFKGDYITHSFGGFDVQMSGHIKDIPEGRILRIWPNGSLNGAGLDQEIFIPKELVPVVASILSRPSFP